MTPPDSGEREVPNHTVCIGWPTIRRVAAEGGVRWPTIRRVAAEGGVHFASNEVSLVAADDLFHADIGAVLSLDLAQRILAVLQREADASASAWSRDEQEGLRALAAELRERLPK